jgi:hypothetical protein
MSETLAPRRSRMQPLDLGYIARQLCYNSVMSIPPNETSEQAVLRRAHNRARMRAAYALDPDKFRQRSRVRRAASPGEWKDYHDPKKHLARVKAAYAADPEKFRARKRTYYAANKEKFKARNAATHKAAYAAKPEQYYARCAQRRAVKIQATPAWSETKLIQAFYAACPTGATVDHWIPLRGKTACGLHVLANLQYLTARENKGKHNRMPSDTLPLFVASDWIRLMLERFYAAQSGEEALAA